MINTNELLLISGPSTARLQMLIKPRDRKNGLREGERYNFMATLRSELLRRNEEGGRSDCERGRRWQTSSERQQIIPGKREKSSPPQVVNSAIKPSLGFVLLGFLQWQLNPALSINQSIKQSINQFTPQRLKWMETNNKQCYLHGRTPQWRGH